MINVADELIDFNFNDLLYDDEHDFFDIDSFKQNNNKTFSQLTNYQKINYITKIFFSDEDYEKEIKDLLKYDIEFKKELLGNIHIRMQKIINDSSILYFKEIVSVIALLSLGNKYIIFNDYSDFNEELVETLFRDYETFLIELQENDKENFELTFKYYVTLLEAFNEICILNSTDIKRKRTINKIIDLLTQSINLLKFQILLDDEKLSILNNIQGKFLLYFTHIPFFNFKDKTSSLLIREFQLNLEKQCDGYFLIESSFNNSQNENLKKFQLTLLTNATFLILTLIKKFEQSCNIEDINSIEPLVEILNEKCFVPKKIELTTYSQLKEDLINLFAYTYNHKGDFNYLDLINYINNTNDINITNLEILQNIILFANNIDNGILKDILNKILNTPKYNNDYHEYFKLKIIDAISLKFIDLDNNEEFKSTIEDILNYTQKYNTASHLMELFAKFYLNAALFYSKQTQIYIEKVQDTYYIFEQITGKYGFANEYQNIINQILINHGIQYTKKLSINEELNYDNLIDIAISMIYANTPTYTYLKYQNIINQTFISQNITKTNLYDTICNTINKNIFFGLATIEIIGLSHQEDKNIDEGYETIINNLIGNYKIKYRYPYTYKKSFMDIYELNKDYIQNSITNLIRIYI